MWVPAAVWQPCKLLYTCYLLTYYHHDHSLWEFTRFIWWMQTERRVAANPQTKPVDLGCESVENWQLPSTSTIAIVIITQPVGWYSFYHPTEGRRLSQPKHCSKGAQPVPKAVYRSGCHDKHKCLRCDSKLGPLKPQPDALTTRPLRPVVTNHNKIHIAYTHWPTDISIIPNKI